MPKIIYQLLIFSCCLSLVLTFSENAAAQKRRKIAAKNPVVENISDEERAVTMENLQGAKVFQLLSELQLGLAEAYLDNRDKGEFKAKAALTKLDIERLRNLDSILTIYAHARGYSIWANYLINREGFGKDAKVDEKIKNYVEVVRRDVEKGLNVNSTSANIIAVRGTLREFDCRLKLKSSVADCYDAPLADFSRAIALKPDDTDFFSLRAEFFERNEKKSLAEQDNQTAESLGNALGLKLELDRTATARQPFRLERANADALYFMQILQLVYNDADVKNQLAEAAILKSFREKLLEYFALADAGYVKANLPKPTAKALEMRGMLRLNLGSSAEYLGFAQPAEVAQKNYDEALKFYNDAIKLDPKFAVAYQSRARLYRKLGNSELAEADEKRFDLLSGK